MIGFRGWLIFASETEEMFYDTAKKLHHHHHQLSSVIKFHQSSSFIRFISHLIHRFSLPALGFGEGANNLIGCQGTRFQIHRSLGKQWLSIRPTRMATAPIMTLVGKKRYHLGPRLHQEAIHIIACVCDIMRIMHKYYIDVYVIY